MASSGITITVPVETGVLLTTLPPFSANLGIEDIQSNSKTILYPNPTRDLVTIVGHALGERIVITNILGKTVLNRIAKQENEVISTADFTSGIYIVSVGNKTKLKLIKEE